MSVDALIPLKTNSVAAVVGCGGKTSLIRLMAEHQRDKGKNVLVAPTTKMYPLALDGVTCKGRLNKSTGKLESLSNDEILSLLPQFDLILLEADGSHGKSVKGWRNDEPVVPPFCTHTIGVLALDYISRPATAENVCHLPEFLSLTGAKVGDPITYDHMIKMVKGMFKNAVGDKYVVLNKITGTSEAAEQCLRAVKNERFKGLMYGNTQTDDWKEV